MNPEPSPEELRESDLGLDIDLLRRRREWVFTLGSIALIVLASLTIAYQVLRPHPFDKQALLSAAQRTVRETLGTQYVYAFSGASEVRIERQEDDKYKLSGEVLVMNEAGASNHFWYDCILMRQAEQAWAPVQLTLLPQ
jgi:hypothetical protein